ncbi:MAG: cytochrome c, partial [Rudanella sp.]|nr:cytochrome c [Rudanella sp.]
AVAKAPAQTLAESMLQMALSAQALDPSASHKLLAILVDRQGEMPLMRDAVLSSLQDGEMAFLMQLWAAPTWQTREPSKEIFVEMLASAIVRKRNPDELSKLFAMLNDTKSPLAWRTKAVLGGLAIGGSASKQKPIKLAAVPRLLTQQNGLVEASRLAMLTSLFEWPGHTVEQGALAKKNVLSDEDQKLFANGRQLYLSTCSGCHGTDGIGVTRFAPPLIGSEWVLGDGKRLALILLHGMEGPVDVAGKVYNKPDILPVMPAHSTMDDASITAILTYIRNEWGNQAGPIPRRTVGMTRIMAQGRVAPWTAKELNKYVADTQAKEGAGSDQLPKQTKPNDR